jgi:hypothetical protein
MSSVGSRLHVEESRRMRVPTRKVACSRVMAAPGRSALVQPYAYPGVRTRSTRSNGLGVASTRRRTMVSAYSCSDHGDHCVLVHTVLHTIARFVRVPPGDFRVFSLEAQWSQRSIVFESAAGRPCVSRAAAHRRPSCSSGAACSRDSAVFVGGSVGIASVRGLTPCCFDLAAESARSWLKSVVL